MTLGNFLRNLVNEPGQYGPGNDENRVPPTLAAPAQDLLLEASILTEIAEECRWNRELPE